MTGLSDLEMTLEKANHLGRFLALLAMKSPLINSFKPGIPIMGHRQTKKLQM